MQVFVMEALFIVTPDWKEVLLLKKKPGSFLAGQHTGIGGKVEPGEYSDITKTLRRELKEESMINESMLYNLQQRCMLTCRKEDPSNNTIIDYHMYAYTAICHEKSMIPLDSNAGTLDRHTITTLSSLELTNFTNCIYKQILTPHHAPFIGSFFYNHEEDMQTIYGH